MLSENGRNWLINGFFLTLAMVDCFFVSHIEPGFTTQMILLLIVGSILNCVRDYREMKWKREHEKQMPEQPVEPRIFEDESRKKETEDKERS